MSHKKLFHFETSHNLLEANNKIAATFSKISKLHRNQRFMTVIAELPWSSSRRNIEENYLSTDPQNQYNGNVARDIMDISSTTVTSGASPHLHR